MNAKHFGILTQLHANTFTVVNPGVIWYDVWNIEFLFVLCTIAPNEQVNDHEDRQTL